MSLLCGAPRYKRHTWVDNEVFEANRDVESVKCSRIYVISQLGLYSPNKQTFIARYQSREIRVWTILITMKFDRRLRNNITSLPVKCQRDINSEHSIPKLQDFARSYDTMPHNKFREVSKPRYWMSCWWYCSEILQVSRQRCCRGACQISERLAKSKPESRAIETSRDLAVRRPSALGGLVRWQSDRNSNDWH